MPGNQPVHERPSNQPPEPSAVNPKGEAEFLKRQADQASIAMNRAINEAKAKLAKGLSLNTIAKEYPLATVATGLVAGFVTASAVTPSKRDSALKRLAELERALHPNGAPGGAAFNGHASPAGPSMVTSVLKSAVTLLRPVVMSGVSSYLAAQKAAGDAVDEAVEETTGTDPTGPNNAAVG